ncbi:hypothetical protein Tco_0281755 [Tanacetum coccineum]
MEEASLSSNKNSYSFLHTRYTTSELISRIAWVSTTKAYFRSLLLEIPNPPYLSWSRGDRMETWNIQVRNVLSIRARKNLHRAFKNFDDFESFSAPMR